MDERLDFNENPNGKLNSPYFLLVRLSHPVKHAVGLIKRIYLRGVWKGNAEVISVQQCTLSEITPLVSYLTAGLPPEALRRAIRTAYRKQGWIAWETQALDIVLLGYKKESMEPNFFE